MLRAFAIALLLITTAVGAVGAISSPQVAQPSREHRATAETGCKRAPKPIVVNLPRSKYPNIDAHIEASWRKGYPKVLTIHRANADERRHKLLNGIPTRPGFDRDEAPAVVLRATWRADVAYVESRQNESAGASLGAQLRGWCSGQRVVYGFGP